MNVHVGPIGRRVNEWLCAEIPRVVISIIWHSCFHLSNCLIFSKKKKKKKIHLFILKMELAGRVTKEKCDSTIPGLSAAHMLSLPGTTSQQQRNTPLLFWSWTSQVLKTRKSQICFIPWDINKSIFPMWSSKGKNTRVKGRNTFIDSYRPLLDCSQQANISNVLISLRSLIHPPT